MLRDKYKYL